MNEFANAAPSAVAAPSAEMCTSVSECPAERVLTAFGEFGADLDAAISNASDPSLAETLRRARSALDAWIVPFMEACREEGRSKRRLADLERDVRTAVSDGLAVSSLVFAMFLLSPDEGSAWWFVLSAPALVTIAYRMIARETGAMYFSERWEPRFDELVRRLGVAEDILRGIPAENRPDPAALIGAARTLSPTFDRFMKRHESF